MRINGSMDDNGCNQYFGSRPFKSDPDPAVHFDTDPDPAFQVDTDPDPDPYRFKVVMYLKQYFLYIFT
jgi:hypothetical protein